MGNKHSMALAVYEETLKSSWLWIKSTSAIVNYIFVQRIPSDIHTLIIAVIWFLVHHVKEVGRPSARCFAIAFRLGTCQYTSNKKRMIFKKSILCFRNCGSIMKKMVHFTPTLIGALADSPCANG